MDTLLRTFLHGIIQIHILHHASYGPVYGSALIAELGRHGYSLSPGTLYPLLHSLAQDELLQQEVRVVHGKQRKYYTITAKGRALLEEVRPKIHELVDEVLEEHGPHQLPEDLNQSDVQDEE
jgi:DNA-binding PadR family transcriptional regulator